MFRIIGRIIRWIGPRRSKVYWGFVFSFIQALFTAMPVMAAAYAINLVLEQTKGGPVIQMPQIFLITAFLVFSVLGRFWFSYLKARNLNGVGYETAADERVRLGDKLKKVSLGFYQNNSAGELTSAVTTDLSFFEMYATNMIDVVVNSYIFVFTIVLCMGFVNPLISVIAVAGVLFSNLFLQLIGRKSQQNASVHQKAQDDMTSATLEYIRGMPIVKSFKQEGAAAERIAKAYQDSKEINIKIEKNFVPLNLLHLFSLKAAAAAMILLAANCVLGGTLEIPMMLMIVIFSFMMFSSTEAMNNAVHVLRTLDVIMDKLDAIEHTPPIDENGREIKLSKFDIDFEDVSFGYKDKKVLERVSLHIPENTATAIVGPSGSGKTTICNLLARFYDVDSGCIRIGGVKISDMKCDSLLADITMVFQNVYLFRDSIANNIKFGKPEATEQEMIEAAKKACCYDFIMSLPDGFDTMIGDGGATLSGGEKQRISIARAMLKDAPIVVLDEATASVDPENEHLIQQAISALTHGKTILIIAHRLATIENADQILVVDHGQIVQRGTHKELLGRPGIYQDFVSIRQKSEGWSIA